MQRIHLSMMSLGLVHPPNSYRTFLTSTPEYSFSPPTRKPRTHTQYHTSIRIFEQLSSSSCCAIDLQNVSKLFPFPTWTAMVATNQSKVVIAFEKFEARIAGKLVTISASLFRTNAHSSSASCETLATLKRQQPH